MHFEFLYQRNEAGNLKDRLNWSVENPCGAKFRAQPVLTIRNSIPLMSINDHITHWALHVHYYQAFSKR